MDGTALVYDEPLVAQAPDRERADTLRKQQREARADRSLAMAENAGKTKIRNDKSSSGGVHLLRSKQREDTRSVLGSLRHRARQHAPSMMAKGEAIVEQTLTAPIRLATSEALTASWLNIIDSFGLTLIYINAHVFGRLTAGSEFFCKLGHEWAKDVPGLSTTAATNKLTKELLGRFGDTIGVIEVMLLILLDIVALIILSLVFVLIVLIVAAVVSPSETIGQILSIV